MAKKPYEPVASYADLKRVEQELNRAETVAKIRELGKRWAKGGLQSLLLYAGRQNDGRGDEAG